jgi:hypothetical protein
MLLAGASATVRDEAEPKAAGADEPDVFLTGNESGDRDRRYLEPMGRKGVKERVERVERGEPPAGASTLKRVVWSSERWMTG